jgi:hypothetical protein
MNPRGWMNDPALRPVKGEFEAREKKADVTDRRNKMTVTNMELKRYDILSNVLSRVIRELKTTAAKPSRTPSKATRLWSIGTEFFGSISAGSVLPTSLIASTSSVRIATSTMTETPVRFLGFER